MIGGLSTICGICSYRWVLSPAVSRSWHCPKCGGKWGDNAAEYPCTCGHRYGDHHNKRGIPPSRVAFAFTIGEAHRLDDVLSTEPEPTPEIGTCKRCPCELYRYAGPNLHSAENS